jgi:capsular polysaccharide biosynthesis protein
MALRRRLGGLRGPYHRYVRKPGLVTLAAGLGRMPSNSLTVGPPRRIGSTGDALATGAITERRPVLDAERLVFDEPRSITPMADFWSLVEQSPDLGQFPRTAAGARCYDIPPGYIHVIPGGRAVGPDGWIVDCEDRLLTDLSPDYRRERYVLSRHPAMNKLRLPRAHRVDGTVAVLATLSADGFYGHWMMDLLPRAAMFARAGIHFEDLDGVYLPEPRHAFEADLIGRLGIRDGQIIDARTVPHIQASMLLVPSWQRNVFVASRWCCETLQAFAPSPDDAPVELSERIFVSRSRAGHRRLVNEAELLRDVLEPRGFVAIRPELMAPAHKTSVFAAARVIVAPLGSSMANLVLCRPGASIVEIMNPRCVQPCTLAIATQLGFDYHVVLAPGVDPGQHEILEDLRVPTELLAAAIDEALA